MILETKRLILRNICMNDANDIFEYSKSPNVGPKAGWKPHENIQETKEIIKSVFIDEPYVFGIIIKETNKLIGSLGLIKDPKRDNPKCLMIGYSLSEDYWNNGYMTEAVNKLVEYGFEQLHLDLISAYCYPNNFASKSVLRKTGFSLEGVLQQCELLYTGEVLDNECYYILNKNY